MPPERVASDPDALYGQAVNAFTRMIDEDVLIRDADPRFYVYRMETPGRAQTGLVAAASIEAYVNGKIRRHELTRPPKETDRVRHMMALDAQTGPVFLVHRSDDTCHRLIAAATEGPPLCRCTLDETVTHTLWPIDGAEQVAAVARAYDDLGALYIADGHHRAAAAARVAADAPADSPVGRFLTVSFPADEVHILGYHRIVRDLNGLTVDAFLAEVRKVMSCEPMNEPVEPKTPHRFGMYVDGAWYRLEAPAGALGTSAIDKLDVSILSRLILEPTLGIDDPRADPRIDFVGGSRGLDALSGAVDRGSAAVAFALFPTTVDDLMSVADAEAIMPPKSTWFEPKLADGLISHMIR